MGGQARSSSRPGLLTAAIAVVSVEALLNVSALIANLSGATIPIPVVVIALLLAVVLAVAVVDLVGFRQRGQTLAVVASALSGALGIVGVIGAPDAGGKTVNAVLLLLAITALGLLTRPATKNALT
jgi:hypothetical protein